MKVITFASFGLLGILFCSNVFAADAGSNATTEIPAASTAVPEAEKIPTINNAPAQTPAAAPATSTNVTPATAAIVTPPGSSLPAIAQAIWVKGAVTAAQPDQAPRPLERRSVLFEHDIIATDKTSSGEIGFTDGSIVSLNPDSQFQIDAYSFKQGGGGGKEDKSVMKLLKGGFRTITGAIPKENPDSYKVDTPVATIGVRGTQYVSMLVEDKGLVLSIEKGGIKITNKAGQLDLNACTGGANCKTFGIVKSFDLPPTPTAVQPKELINVAPVTPVPHGWGAPGEQGAPGTPPVPVTNSYAPTSHPGGGAGRTGGFCVGYLEDLYQRIPHYFG